MKKSFIYSTILAAAAMLAAPFTVNAQEEEKPDVVMNKTVSGPDANGVYNIQLETYVTGKTISVETEERIPADIVLVLDNSGSMADNFNINTYNAQSSRSYSYDDSGDYYYLYDDLYYEVEFVNDGGIGIFEDPKYRMYFSVNGTKHYLSGTTETTTKPAGKTDDDDIIWTGVLYTKTSTSQKKSAALKSSVKKFIDVVRKDAIENEVTHRVSIIQFNYDDFPYDSDPSDISKSDYINPSKDIYLKEYGYAKPDYYCTSIYKRFVDVSDETLAESLKSSLDDLRWDGATAADYGLILADCNVNSFAREGAAKTVVLFTDGEPNHSSGFSTSVANKAIVQALSLKGNDVRVFTVGLFSKHDDDVDTYMTAVSSNYPNASSMTSLGSLGDKTGYYKDASSGNLEEVFVSIAHESTSYVASVEVTNSARLIDIVTDTFELPEGADEDDITIKVASYDVANDKFSDVLRNPSETVIPSVSKSKDGTTTISVTGYPFSEHYCGLGNEGKGEKLVINVPIVPKSGFLGGLDIPTNGAESGLYLNDTDDEPIAKFDVPTVDLPINIIIKKEGLRPGESAIFDVISSDPEASNPVATLILTGGQTGDPAPTAQVTGLDPNFVYTVKESEWSWTYDSKTGSMSTKDVSANPFTFKNEKKDVDVKNAEATILNKFEKIK